MPEWERTAELCKEAGIMVAKVDAIAEKALAQQNEVQSGHQKGFQQLKTEVFPHAEALPEPQSQDS